jgi:hypothetical protein
MSIELRKHLFNRGAALVLHGEPGLADADLSPLLDFSIEEREALTVVVLSNTDLTGRCLRYLTCLPNLREIYLNGTGLPDEAPLDLIGSGVEVLNLDDTRIGDSGIAKLGAASGLRLVSLRNTRITDRGAHMLGNLPGLREYHLSGTKVSDFAIRRLDNALELAGTSAAFVFRSAFHQMNLLLHRALRRAARTTAPRRLAIAPDQHRRGRRLSAFSPLPPAPLSRP